MDCDWHVTWAEPLSYGIQHQLQRDSVRNEFDCRTSSWFPESWGMGCVVENTHTHPHLVTQGYEYRGKPCLSDSQILTKPCWFSTYGPWDYNPGARSKPALPSLPIIHFVSVKTITTCCFLKAYFSSIIKTAGGWDTNSVARALSCLLPLFPSPNSLNTFPLLLIRPSKLLEKWWYKGIQF